ncbi:MAG TPA: adenine nucleotide alpha hydrolase family protein [Candidatus Atribacteria bacterium]|nr:adenine nucleotide alpha hydrolase family protein [Candidatus Atribacteria bacterium]
MKCRICGKEAEIKLPEHNIALCREDFINFFERRVSKAIKKYRMFKKNENILVAVSGGKDSLALWYVLNKLDYKTYGYYLHLGIKEYSDKSLELIEKFAKKNNLKFTVEYVKEKLGYTIEEIAQKTRHTPCSICGTIKRYYMNFFASNFDCIATGHNLDDEVGVLFHNTLNWEIEYLARQYPVLQKEGSLNKKVKPLILVTEKETTAYAFYNDIEYIEQECPLVRGSTFLRNKHIINYIENRMPGTKLRFYTGFLKNHRLFGKPEKKELNACKECGYLTIGELCFICKLKKRLQSS